MGRQVNHKILSKAQFRRFYIGDKSLQTALGLRSRVMPVIGSSISEICNNHMIKAKKILNRRCSEDVMLPMCKVIASGVSCLVVP